MYKRNVEIYKKVEKTTSSQRETEARVLTQGALKLKWCQENWNSEERRKLLAEALKYNQQIWSIFQADLLSGKSPLPENLRQNLLRLSVFVDKQIFQVMAYPSPDKLTPIINVNLGLAAGLEKKVPVSQTSHVPAEPQKNGIEIKG